MFVVFIKTGPREKFEARCSVLGAGVSERAPMKSWYEINFGSQSCALQLVPLSLKVLKTLESSESTQS